MRESTIALIEEVLGILRVRLADLPEDEAMTITIATSIDLFFNLARTAPIEGIKQIMIERMKDCISTLEKMPPE